MAKEAPILLLLSPLQKIQQISTESVRILQEISNQIDSVIKSGIEVKNIFVEQRDALFDMRNSLKSIEASLSGKGSPKGGGGGSAAPSAGTSFKLGTLLIFAAAGLAGASQFLQFTANVTPKQLFTVLLISLAMQPMIKSFIELMNIIAPAKTLLGRAGNFALDKLGAKKSKGMSKNKAIALSILVMISAAISLVTVSAILRLMSAPSIGQVLTALMIGISMGPMVGVFISVVAALKHAKIKPNLKGLKQIGFASLVMVAVALGIAGVAMALQLLPPEFIEPPEIMWVLQTGFMLYIFSLPLTRIMKATRGLSISKLAFAAIALPLIAFTVVGIALAFKYLPTGIPAPDLMWSLKTGIALFVISFSFTKILRAIKRSSIKDIIFAGLAVPIMATAIVGIAFIFIQLAKIAGYEANAPDAVWALKSGFAILAFAASYILISIAAKRMGLKGLAYGALGVIAVAGAIVGAAWILSYLPNEFIAPPTDWSLKVGLAFVAFTISFMLVSLIAKTVGIKGIALGALGVIAIAGAILGAAWILSFLPSDFAAPPTDWSIGAAIAITLFAVPMAIIGGLAMLLTPVGILLGAAGIILIAGTMWVVAWIFSKLPDLSAISKNFTDAIMYPINAMIGGLKRFKDEIGIENMVPLAGGILAIAGSWLVLTAAMAGQGIGGAIGAVGNAIGEGINSVVKFFGGKGSMGPKELLELLINKADGLRKIAGPMKKIGIGFTGISMNSKGVQRALWALAPLTDEDKVKQLKNASYSISRMASGYSSIADSTKAMNVDALHATTNMFNAIARVAEAKGDDILTTISEELMEAVKQLSATVKNLEESNGKNSESMTDSISSTLTGFIDKIKGKSDEEGQETGLIDIEPIVAAIQDLEDRFSRPIRIVD